LKLRGFDSADVVLVNVENEQVETRTANNLVSIFFAILNPDRQNISLRESSLMVKLNRFQQRRFKFLEMLCDLTLSALIL
jgi:hypothetical protein